MVEEPAEERMLTGVFRNCGHTVPRKRPPLSTTIKWAMNKIPRPPHMQAYPLVRIRPKPPMPRTVFTDHPPRIPCSYPVNAAVPPPDCISGKSLTFHELYLIRSAHIQFSIQLSHGLSWQTLPTQQMHIPVLSTTLRHGMNGRQGGCCHTPICPHHLYPVLYQMHTFHRPDLPCYITTGIHMNIDIMPIRSKVPAQLVYLPR